MKKPRALLKGDKIAVVSLSSGMLGDDCCRHNLDIGVRRLKKLGLEPVFMPNSLRGSDYLREYPASRAADLKTAFMDDSISGIICAIGGDDTYRLLPYLLEDDEFIDLVNSRPKLFSGFSDTTVNHLMFYKLGLVTYYGPAFICDLGEIADEMLPYTLRAFQSFFKGCEKLEITSSDVWYEERTDFSEAAVGTERIQHEEEHGYELLQGNSVFSGRLLGGCLESMYDLLTGARYGNENEFCSKYSLFPEREEWENKILFVETCEEKPKPELLRDELMAIKERGVFDAVNGILVGKPQDETYYEEYKQLYLDVVGNKDIPILYNINFGHSLPRCVIPYGIEAKADAERKNIQLMEPYLI